MSVTYRNPWHKPGGLYGPERYETSAKPIEHAGALIYERVSGHVWDVVRNGVCIHQRAGLEGAKRAAEQMKGID